MGNKGRCAELAANQEARLSVPPCTSPKGCVEAATRWCRVAPLASMETTMAPGGTNETSTGTGDRLESPLVWLNVPQICCIIVPSEGMMASGRNFCATRLHHGQQTHRGEGR